MSRYDDGIAIKVRNLSKMYKVYSKPSDMLWELVRGKPRHSEFWALRDVSFDVKRGDVVGVIGRNGAGKTTMLRILADTLDKSSGEVEVRGKISAIMALGTGFNPELSGRENILMGGLCLGMTRAEIMKKTDSIIDFSGLKDFIEQPVKTYSSGMMARLAFSTAASVEPDILIIDEALSTGDMAFSAKSFVRIRKIASSGATVFFVTHALQQIYELCNYSILLENGRIMEMGDPRQVGYAYEQMMHEEMAELNKKAPPVYSFGGQTLGEEGPSVEDSLTDEEGPSVEDSLTDEEDPSVEDTLTDEEETELARVLDVSVLDEQGDQVGKLYQEESYTIRIRVLCNQSFESISIGYRIQSPSGTAVYGTSTAVQGIKVSAQEGEIVSVDFSFACSLADGAYIFSGAVAEQLGEVSEHYHYNMIHFFADATILEVVGENVFAGCVDLKSEVKSVQNQLPSSTLNA